MSGSNIHGKSDRRGKLICSVKIALKPKQFDNFSFAHIFACSFYLSIWNLYTCIYVRRKCSNMSLLQHALFCEKILASDLNSNFEKAANGSSRRCSYGSKYQFLKETFRARIFISDDVSQIQKQFLRNTISSQNHLSQHEKRVRPRQKTKNTLKQARIVTITHWNMAYSPKSCLLCFDSPLLFQTETQTNRYSSVYGSSWS